MNGILRFFFFSSSNFKPTQTRVLLICCIVEIQLINGRVLSTHFFFFFFCAIGAVSGRLGLFFLFKFTRGPYPSSSRLLTVRIDYWPYVSWTINSRFIRSETTGVGMPNNISIKPIVYGSAGDHRPPPPANACGVKKTLANSPKHFADT